MPDQALDDGHALGSVRDEEASAAAGVDRYRATCSCARMPDHPPLSRDQILAAHAAHVHTRPGPCKRPSGLPYGVRITIVAGLMMALWYACYTTGQAITRHHGLVGVSARAVLGGSHLAGLALSFGLMVLVRRFITPTRD